MKQIAIIGSGNLAEALARAVAAADGLHLVQLFARNAAQGGAVAALARTAWTADPRRPARADPPPITVSDRAPGGGAARAGGSACSGAGSAGGSGRVTVVGATCTVPGLTAQ